MAHHLDEKFNDRSAHVLIVNGYQSSQTSLIKALHRLGFVNIQISKDLHDLRERLRWTRVDLAFVALDDDNESEAMALLRDFYATPQQKARFSYIFREKDGPLLLEAFQNGLLHAMDLNLSMDTNAWESELLAFLETSHECFLKGRHEAYLAARSMRLHLIALHNWTELVRLEKSMVEAFPNDLNNVFRLIEAHFEAGEYPQGRELIAELQQADPNFPKDRIEELWQRFPGANTEGAKQIGPRLGLRHVIVIERDLAERNALNHALKRLGIEAFISYGSYDDAWQAIKKGLAVDLLIADWVVLQGDLSPAQFFQRVRANEDLAFVPLCLLGSRFRNDDSQLIADLNVLQIVPKPLREDQVAIAVSFALEQYRRPSERRNMELKIIQSLHEGHKNFAYHLRKLYLGQSSIDLARKYYVEAIFLYHHKSFTKAKNHLVKGLELAAKNSDHRGVRINVDKMFLLAQCMIQLDNRTAALHVLEKASTLSPLNIRILLAIAELHQDLGQYREAEAAFRKAEKIDPENIHVLMTAARLSIVSVVEEGPRKDETRDEMVLLLNNQAVALIQRDQGQKAIDLYRSAIAVLKVGNNAHLGTLHYNLALAYLRLEKREEAVRSLAIACRYPESKIHSRATSLKQRLQANPEFVLPTRMEVTVHRSRSPFTYWRVSTLKPSIALIGLYRYEETKQDPLAS